MAAAPAFSLATGGRAASVQVKEGLVRTAASEPGVSRADLTELASYGIGCFAVTEDCRKKCPRGGAQSVRDAGAQLTDEEIDAMHRRVSPSVCAVAAASLWVSHQHDNAQAEDDDTAALN